MINAAVVGIRSGDRRHRLVEWQRRHQPWREPRGLSVEVMREKNIGCIRAYEDVMADDG